MKADSYNALISGFAGIAQLLDLPEKDAKDQNIVVAAVVRWLGENQGWRFWRVTHPKIRKDISS